MSQTGVFSSSSSSLLLYDCTTIVGAWNRLLPGPGLTAPSGEKNDDDDNDDDDVKDDDIDRFPKFQFPFFEALK